MSTKYYKNKDNKKDKITQPLSKFHNYIKNLLISTYAYEKNVIDFGSGIGGDMLKFYHNRVKTYIGIDNNSDNIWSIGDCSIRRYKVNIKKYRDFPMMRFIHADIGTILSVEDQQNKLSNISVQSCNNIQTYFNPSKYGYYDVINCQFVIHYLFKDEDSFNNMCNNIKMYLKSGGYFIVTVFDASKILELFDGKDEYECCYIDENNRPNLLFKISVDDTTDINRVGYGIPINVYNKMISDTVMTEYLVDPEFLISELKSKANLTLHESKSFGEVYEENRKLFTEDIYTMNYIPPILKDVSTFYDQKTDIDKQLLEFSKLNRYYVFTKD